MSGRGAGYCARNQQPGFMSRFFGRGAGGGSGWNRGGGRGGGFGWRNMFWSTGLPKWMRFGGGPVSQTNADVRTEKQALENQVDFLKGQLSRIQQRLNDLESGTASK